MGKFNKTGKRGMPTLNTSSLPDLIFTLLFFFMIVTTMREVSLKVEFKIPQGTELEKLEKKSLVTFIYVGKPTAEFRKKLGSESRIQLNDAYAEVDEIQAYVTNERSSMKEEDQPFMTVSLKIDQDTKMGIVTDIKQALRQAYAPFASYSTGFAGSTLGRISGYVFVPFERGINTVGGWLRSRADSLEDLADAQAKNDELQSQVDELTLENSRLMQNQYRLEELEELYALDQTYSEYNKVAANIIASDSGNWFNTFVIDKGSSDGIQVDMNVIAGSGLVGIVTRVGDNWAQVRAIIDDMSNVSAQVLSTSDLCFVKGDLQLMENGLIQISQLRDPEGEASIGDTVVTSHVSDKYHSGILIGYINELTLDSNNLTRSGTLTPAVDFEHLHSVLVITDLKQSVDVEE